MRHSKIEEELIAKDYSEVPGYLESISEVKCLSLVATVAVAAAGTAYGIYSSEEQKKAQRKAEAANDAANQKLEREQKDQKLIEEFATEARDRARLRQRGTSLSQWWSGRNFPDKSDV